LQLVVLDGLTGALIPLCRERVAGLEKIRSGAEGLFTASVAKTSIVGQIKLSEPPTATDYAQGSKSKEFKGNGCGRRISAPNPGGQYGQRPIFGKITGGVWHKPL
jgi:hypothetical protein